MDLFAPRSGGNAAQVARIKTWARELLAIDSDTTVLVTELQCSEPGCPPIETVIAVLAPGAPRQYKVHRAIAEVTRADLETVVACAARVRAPTLEARGRTSGSEPA
ncbi:hypothetical protein [Gemmatimonas sp.]|uniref:hypothetical protein n=1 Tax=Gemmatimonas sp. TaxID=1962908 RepID=UPI0025C40D4C|nr:hypothetical protein [Gemmatimonas sp.]MCA2985180.1 hypothetical protein [Gemmatimonas sp.]MCA2995823.1 hypothetical protein [Gemmatimonas sp.]